VVPKKEAKCFFLEPHPGGRDSLGRRSRRHSARSVRRDGGKKSEAPTWEVKGGDL